MPKILIIGGGFAGVWAALTAAREVDKNGADITVTLISKDPYMTIRPRLYESDPETLRVSLSQTLNPVAVEFIQGTVKAIDISDQSILFEDANGADVTRSYDRLILATGSEMPSLPIPGLKEHSWNIDNYASAVSLDEHLGKIAGTPEVQGHNTFVILGAGSTGIELAAEMRDRIAAHSSAETADVARIILADQAAVIGPELGDNSRPIIEKALGEANIEIRLETSIESITPDAVYFKDGDVICTKTVIITAGQRANILTEVLNTDRDQLGRVVVDDELRAKNLSNIFVTGDVARAYVDDDHVALMSCQHASRMGKFAGYNAAHDLLDLPLQPYRQSDYVTCLHLGRFGGLFTKGWDRKVEQSGIEVRQLKQEINTVWIYPPTGTREQILSASDVDTSPRC